MRRATPLLVTLHLLAGAISPAALAAEPAESAPGALRRPPDVAPLERALGEAEAKIQAWGGVLGASVLDVGSGEVLAARGADRLVNPASNAKLFTAATALRHLGPAHRFVTSVHGEAQGGVVSALVIRGHGDPSLTTGDLAALVRELRDRGVERLEGDVIVDGSYFDERFIPPAFEQQPEEWAAFRAPVSAIAVDGNTVSVVVRPTVAGSDASLAALPVGFVELAGAVATSARDRPQSIALELSRAPGGRVAVRVRGSVPVGAGMVRLVRRADDPSLLAGHALRALLVEAGMAAPGRVRRGSAGSLPALALHRSAPLGRLLGELGKASDNFHAEMILKATAAEVKGAPGRSEDGAGLVLDLLRRMGAAPEGTRFENGSGLFDAARTTARATATFLRGAYLDPAIGPELVASLSVAGVDGTLRGRLRSLAPTRALRAKTGTLRDVIALSGYALRDDGRPPLAFALFVNGVAGRNADVRKVLDGVAERVLSTARRPHQATAPR